VVVATVILEQKRAPTTVAKTAVVAPVRRIPIGGAGFHKEVKADRSDGEWASLVDLGADRPEKVA
jgi:hypothetical protein